MEQVLKPEILHSTNNYNYGIFYMEHRNRIYEADDALIRIKPDQIIGWGLEEGAVQAHNRKAREG